MGQGLLVRMHAKRGKESAVETLLQSALATLNEGENSVASFVVRFTRREFGIFKFFPDDDAREAHLAGPAAALQARTPELFETMPALRKFDVLAEKLPVVSTNSDTKAVLLTFRPRTGHEQEVEDFLHYAKELVLNERNTTAWFALHADDGAYGIFDVFPGYEDRFMHLVGHVPRELAKQAFSLLGSVPNLEMMNVHSERIGANVLGTKVH